MKSYAQRLSDAIAINNKPMATIDNSKQKFPIGAKVHITKNMPPEMSHFQSDKNATVLYTYAQKFWGNNFTSYALEIDNHGFSAWYYEDQLTLMKE